GDHAGLAHPPGQQRLVEHVVDLVAAGVVEVLELEQDPGAAGELREARGLGEQRGAPGVLGGQLPQLGGELRVHDRLLVHLDELVERGHQRLGEEAPPEVAEVRAGLGAQLGGGSCEVEERLLHGGALGAGAAHAWPPSGTGRARRATRRYEPTAAAGSPEVTSASPTRTASAPAAA